MQVTVLVGRQKHALTLPASATFADVQVVLLAALSAPTSARPGDVKLLWRGRAVADVTAGTAAAGVVDGARLVALVPRSCLPAAGAGGGGGCSSGGGGGGSGSSGGGGGGSGRSGGGGGPAIQPTAKAAAAGPPIDLGDPVPTDGSPHVLVLHGGARYCVRLPPAERPATGVTPAPPPHPFATLTDRLAALTGLLPPHQRLLLRGAPFTGSTPPGRLRAGAKLLLLRSESGAAADDAAADADAVAADVAATTAGLRSLLATGGRAGGTEGDVRGGVLLARGEDLARVVADRVGGGGVAAQRLRAAAAEMGDVMDLVRAALRRER